MAQVAVGIKVIVGAKMKRGYKKGAAEKHLKKVLNHIEREYKKTTATWNHKPKFAKVAHVGLLKAEGRVFTTNLQFIRVDVGTPGKNIFPIKGPLLHYQGDFTPKTKPRSISSRQGGKSGAWVHTSMAPWPGITAREFTPTIAKAAKPIMDKEMGAAMKEQIFPHHSGGSN